MNSSSGGSGGGLALDQLANIYMGGKLPLIFSFHSHLAP